jgi:predicted GIY-YIG superfamily endonuclease
MSTRKTYWVYILASRKNGTLYIGVTDSSTNTRKTPQRLRVLPSVTKSIGSSISKTTAT